MKTCINCRHVVRDRDELTCEHEKFKFGYGCLPEDIPSDGLHIENNEGWGWFVGPDFGCIHFEEKVI